MTIASFHRHRLARRRMLALGCTVLVQSGLLLMLRAKYLEVPIARAEVWVDLLAARTFGTANQGAHSIAHRISSNPAPVDCAKAGAANSSARANRGAGSSKSVFRTSQWRKQIRSTPRLEHEHSAESHFRTARVAPAMAIDGTPVGEELRRFDHYLLNACGLAENTPRTRYASLAGFCANGLARMPSNSTRSSQSKFAASFPNKPRSTRRSPA
jgi:hypothetical protein